MPRRSCLGVPPTPCPTQALAEPGKPRCASCEQQHQRQRNATRPQYRGDWPTIAKQTIAAYRAIYGDVCPGWQREPHEIPPSDWACDHDLGALCIRCNGSKGGSHDRARAVAQRETLN